MTAGEPGPAAAPIIDAVKAGDLERVRSLVATDRQLAAVRGDHDKTPLHWAAEKDRPEMVDLLLAGGADLEARTSWGATAFDWAASMGSARAAERLLAAGASGLNLVSAAGLGRLEEVRRIVEGGDPLEHHRRRGAPDRPDDDWPASSAHIRGDVLSDALYAAARNGHTAVVSFLAGKGAAIDARGVFGATALHWAAYGGHTETVDWLLAHGADLHLQDPRFEADAAGWALEGGHQPLAERIRGASPGR